MNNKNKIELSIVIPTINSNDYIVNTLNKLNSCLQKHYITYEILLVNDNSNTTTIKKLQQYKKKNKFIKIIALKERHRQKNTVCLGYYLAKGKYVITLDDDMLNEIDYIKELLYAIKQNSSWIVSSYYNTKTNTKYTISRQFMLFILNNILFIKYKKTKYFSSFKIFNKYLLNLNDIDNIYYFWNIPPNKITTLKLSNFSTKNIRKTNYTYIDYLDTFYHILLKTIQKISYIAIIVVLCIYHSNFSFIVLSFFTLILLVTMLLLYLDKKKFKSIAYYEVY